ncbi:MAG: hypothetical protein ACRYF9_20830 [Janthinobacterium lividum]|jgi:hypothetical protein|uniref:hypothetical protein n=1 Tax=Pseudomonas TaxID=286 RepID=UPI001CFB8C67|nr:MULTISPECIES: hypothetical protein [Pseudomonas]
MRLQSLITLTALAAILPFASAQAGTWPAGTKDTFLKQCEDTAGQHVSAAIAKQHCTCSADAIAKKLSDADIKALTGPTAPSEELQGRMMAAVSACQVQK